MAIYLLVFASGVAVGAVLAVAGFIMAFTSIDR